MKILLWGDSHAADLYPGLVQLLKGKPARLSEYAAAACPPLLGENTRKNRNCARVNDFVIDQLPNLKPDLVIMSARWGQYDLHPLTATIMKLHAAGVRRIILIGPVPEWEGTPRKDLLRAYLRTKTLPVRSKALLEPELDVRLADDSARLGIKYISAYKALCKGRECRVFVDGRPTVLDKAHFTVEGSKYFVSRIARQLGF